MEKKIHQSPPFGQEISCVMKKINSEFLLDCEKLSVLLKSILIKENFGILNFVSHNFEPKGFTIIALLSESHLAIHTYPEYNSIYFNMYSCRGPKDAKPTFDFLKNKLQPKEILFYEEKEIPVQDLNAHPH
ncbi:MAG: S-adenosylmethionine decarboxylase [archaeon]